MISDFKGIIKLSAHQCVLISQAVFLLYCVYNNPLRGGVYDRREFNSIKQIFK